MPFLYRPFGAASISTAPLEPELVHRWCPTKMRRTSGSAHAPAQTRRRSVKALCSSQRTCRRRAHRMRYRTDPSPPPNQLPIVVVTRLAAARHRDLQFSHTSVEPGHSFLQRVMCPRPPRYPALTLAPHDRPSLARSGNTDAISRTPSVSATDAQDHQHASPRRLQMSRLTSNGRAQPRRNHGRRRKCGGVAAGRRVKRRRRRLKARGGDAKR